ncbi:hypothetical protein [Microcoleus sp. B4-D4]|uniref:hypothetical protein n=1 Tax=Microcoleus sp. B4-D4 TaxID=2818667 RepID=UPI002FD20E41
MIPAPVTRSATTVPGSGIDVAALCGVELLVYMFVKFGEGVGMGVGDGSTCDCGTGSGTGAGDARVPERRDSMDGLDGASGLGELSGLQALEKFPGPHTSTCAAPGGAAAK